MLQHVALEREARAEQLFKFPEHCVFRKNAREFRLAETYLRVVVHKFLPADFVEVALFVSERGQRVYVGNKLAFVRLLKPQFLRQAAQKRLFVDEHVRRAHSRQSGVEIRVAVEVVDYVVVRQVEAVEVLFSGFVAVSVAEEGNLPDCEHERNRYHDQQNREYNFVVFL